MDQSDRLFVHVTHEIRNQYNCDHMLDRPQHKLLLIIDPAHLNFKLVASWILKIEWIFGKLLSLIFFKQIHCLLQLWHSRCKFYRNKSQNQLLYRQNEQRVYNIGGKLTAIVLEKTFAIEPYSNIDLVLIKFKPVLFFTLKFFVPLKKFHSYI